MQCPGWCWDGGDGRTGPMATEVTGPTGLTSRRSPVRAWSSRLSSLQGLRRPLSKARRVGRTEVGGIVPQDCRRPCCTASYSGGDGLTGGVGGTVPGRDSQARRGMDPSLTWAPANVSALNALSGEHVWRRRACEVLERDGTSLEGAFSSRSRRDLARGGVQPPSEAESRSRGRPAPSEAEPHPRGRPAFERGGIPLEGAFSP
jgi:hypothetical protein